MFRQLRREWHWLVALCLVLLGVDLMVLDLDGVVLPQAQAQSEYVYCNGVPYNPNTQGCCNGQIYDLASQGCCNGTTVFTFIHDCCCGGEVFVCPNTAITP